MSWHDPHVVSYLHCCICMRLAVKCLLHESYMFLIWDPLCVADIHTVSMYDCPTGYALHCCPALNSCEHAIRLANCCAATAWSVILTSICCCFRYRVLDECDEMLNMGFVDDVEMILNAGGSSENMQTLLFSATLPPWVKDITRRFLRKEQRLVDLVGSQKMKVW